MYVKYVKLTSPVTASYLREHHFIAQTGPLCCAGRDLTRLKNLKLSGPWAGLVSRRVGGKSWPMQTSTYSTCFASSVREDTDACASNVWAVCGL